LTRDFYSKELDDLKLPKSVKAFGQIETTLIEVRGVCQECTGRSDGEPGFDKGGDSRNE
jgi:hypothetical protein